jgi:hypothetical protein
MMSKNDILTHIFNNKLLNDAITNIVSAAHKDDFKGFFILQVAEIAEEKLQALYAKNELDFYCLKIMTNQWKSTKSPYYKVYRNGGAPASQRIEFVDIEDYLRINQNKLVDEEDIHIDAKKIKSNILELLDLQYDNIIANQYHKTLFFMYYFDDMTLKQIEAATKINKDAISRSVRRTKAYLKNKIKI